MTLADLKRGQHAVITDVSSKEIPLKLLERGCLPCNAVELGAISSFSDPMYLNINGAHLAIRKETAAHIVIELKDE